ncbi:MAG: DUF2304 domain-containing protein [Proteobacteria bacterium]|nr:DUF2304 domain-containing protein [Pseudomonadota bacterium]
MPLRQKIFVILISIALMIFIVELVRRRKLREEYSWLWLLTGVIILILASWHDLLIYVTQFIGAALPTSTLFFLGLVFLFLIAVQFSTKISKLTDQVKNLAQENALLKSRIEKMEGNKEKGIEERQEKD